jgi:hypothetical protein
VIGILRRLIKGQGSARRRLLLGVDRSLYVGSILPRWLVVTCGREVGEDFPAKFSELNVVDEAPVVDVLQELAADLEQKLGVLAGEFSPPLDRCRELVHPLERR